MSDVTHLGLGQHLLARERLERALKLAETHEGDRATLADVRLALAEALWHTGADRPRARVLAQVARDGYLRLGKRGERGLKNAREWIAMPR